MPVCLILLLLLFLLFSLVCCAFRKYYDTMPSYLQNSNCELKACYHKHIWEKTRGNWKIVIKFRKWLKWENDDDKKGNRQKTMKMKQEKQLVWHKPCYITNICTLHTENRVNCQKMRWLWSDLQPQNIHFKWLRLKTSFFDLLDFFL